MTRQGQYFLAHFELISYDTLENLWFTFSENESKMCPQNVGVRIVLESDAWNDILKAFFQFFDWVIFSKNAETFIGLF